MTLKDLILMYRKDVGVTLLVILTLVQITPIKLNPWSWLAKKLGNALNADLKNQITGLQGEVSDLRNEISEVKESIGESEALASRTRILHFGDELLRGDPHTKEHFDQILRDCDTYEDYCLDHPKFENNVAVMTIGRIKSVYQERLEKNDFLH